MKKILFLNTTKLAVLSAMLLLAVFCTIGMSFTPAEEGENMVDSSDSTYISGSRKLHGYYETGSGCNANTNYVHEEDDATVTAYVDVKDYEGDVEEVGTVILDYRGVADYTNVESISGNETKEATIKWTCGVDANVDASILEANHKLEVIFTASEPKKEGYIFVGWFDAVGNIASESLSFSKRITIGENEEKTEGILSYVESQNPGTYSYTEKYYARYEKQQEEFSVRFESAKGDGSYTYQIGETTYTVTEEGKEETLDGKTSTTLVATANNDIFWGWYVSYDGGNTYGLLSKETTYTYTFNRQAIVYALFIPSDAALFIIKGVDGEEYWNLNEACEKAKSSELKVVLPKADGTLYPLSILNGSSKNYTIPADVTLLVPYEKDYKTVWNNVEYAINVDFAPANCKPYRTLTLAEDVTINVNGKIEVAAKHISKGQQSLPKAGNNGAIYQTYGEIVMSANSYINLNSGAFLYAWGRVWGSEQSKITARDGSVAYESFQITDYQGGTRTKAMYSDRKDYKIFPFSQYYIQNIEVPMRFEYGAKEYANTMLTVSESTEAPMKNLPIIGNGSFLFNLNASGAYVEKSYNSTTDRQVYKMGGKTSLENFQTSIKILIELSINTADYLLPLTNNMEVYVESGETTININMILNADTKVVIREGAKMIIGNDYSLYAYDKADWKGAFAFVAAPNTKVAPLCYTLPYATTTGKPSTVSSSTFSANLPIRTSVEDATLQVDGELIVNGKLYVSSGNKDSCANICSTNSGKVIFPSENKVTSDYTVYHLNTANGNTLSASVGTVYETTFSAAQLHNDEEKNPTYHYTQTAESKADDTYEYDKELGRWRCLKTITWDANGGTIEPTTTIVGREEPLSLYFSESLPIPTKTDYTFMGWFTAASGGTQITTETIVNDNVTYYAQWTLNIVDPPLDIVDADNTKNTLTINTNGWASSGWPYTINGTPYEKTARKADRTLVIPYDGNPNDDMAIVVTKTGGEIVSSHIYKVPFVYNTSNATLSGTDANRIVFVKSGTTLQTTDGAEAKEIHVAPGAELKVTGTLTVGKLVLRTTPWQSAVLTIENGGEIEEGGQVYYSRISPDSKQYYQFGLPLSCALAKVKMSNTDKLGGSQPKYGTAWMLKSYSESSRAEKGIREDGANWSLLPSEGTITAGVGYEMFSNSNYYREFYFPVDLTKATTQVSVQYTDGTIGAEHNGWNIITSPLTSRANVPIIDPATAFKVCWLQADGSYEQELPTVFPPAIPFSIQTSAEGKLNFAIPTTAAAPRKLSAAEALTETEWVHLDIFDAYGEGDETSLFVHPTRFEQTYKTGIDVAKQSLTAARPIIYSTHAYGDMAFAGVADSLLENGIDLVVYSPAAQELTFSLRENKFLHRLEYLWLADNETGERTDLLIDDYTCRANAGTTKGRFVLNGRFKAPQISTGIGNTQTDYNIYAIGNNIAISGVEQGTPIYVFDAVGHMIYTTAATSDEVIVPAPCAGVYMLTIGGRTAKLVVNK